MFCYKCGKELNDGNKFCTECGAQLDGSNINHNTIQGGGIKKYMGYIILFLFIMLHGLVVNNNIIQILNQILGYFSNEYESRLGKFFELPEAQLPLTYEHFGTFMMVALVGVILDIVVVFLIAKNYDKKISLNQTMDIIANTYVPFIIGLVLNLVLGFVYVPATLGIYGASLIIHLLLLYKETEKNLDLEKSPVKEFSLYVVIVAIVVSIMLFVSVENSVVTLFNTLEESIGSMFTDFFSGFEW